MPVAATLYKPHYAFFLVVFSKSYKKFHVFFIQILIFQLGKDLGYSNLNLSTNQFIVFNKFYFQVVTSAINEPTFENQFCCYTMSDVSQDWEKMLVRLVMLSYENDGEKMADLVWFVWVLKHYIPYTFIVIHVHCVWERCAKRVCIYRNISKKCMTRLKRHPVLRD